MITIKGDNTILPIYLAMLEDEQDKKKITELYEEFLYACLHVALKITNNITMAEDAVLSVIKHKEEMFALSRRNFRKKIVIIVKNKCIDIIRKNKLTSYTFIDDMENELASDTLPVDRQELEKMYSFSEAHIVKMKKLFGQDKRKDIFRWNRIWGRSVAAVIVITMALLANANSDTDTVT